MEYKLNAVNCKSCNQQWIAPTGNFICLCGTYIDLSAHPSILINTPPVSDNFKTILQSKIDYYGETKFAYESACNEYITRLTTEAEGFAEWLRLNYQNSPLEFDNYWEDIKGFPNHTGKCYTTSELLQTFRKL